MKTFCFLFILLNFTSSQNKTVKKKNRTEHGLFLRLRPEEELSVTNDLYAEKYERLNVFIEKVMRWISSAKEIIEHN